MRDQFRTIRQSLGPIPLRVFESASTVAFTWYWGRRSWLESHDVAVTIIDTALIFFVILFGLLTVHLTLFATKKVRETEPKVQVRSVGTVRGIMKDAATQEDWGKMEVRGEVRGIAGAGVECQAVVAKIRYRPLDGGAFVEEASFGQILLTWDNTKETERRISKGRVCRFTLVRVEQYVDRLAMVRAIPIELYRRAFGGPRDYEFDVIILSGGSEIPITFRVRWPGTWDSLSAVETQYV